MSTSGRAFSRIAYGTWRILNDPELATPQALCARLEACVDAGITTLDTAEIYGRYDVEELLGQALKLAPGLRDKLQIVTKCGIYVPVPRHPERRTAHYNASAERLIKSAEKSLRLLGTDRLDALLVHRPDWLSSADETAAGFEQLLHDGKILAAGASNFDVAQFDLLNARLEERLAGPLVTNQIEMSLFHMDPLADGTLAQAEKLRANPMLWSPLGGGRLFKADDEAAQRVRTAAAAMAGRYEQADASMLALAWLLALPAQPTVVLGTNKIERIADAARAARLALGREDWYALWEAAKGRRVP